AVHRKESAISAGRSLERAEELALDAREIDRGQGPARCDHRRAVGRHQVDVGARVEYSHCSANLATNLAVALENILPEEHGEILVTAAHGIEGGDLLLALSDEHFGHVRIIPRVWRPRDLPPLKGCS